MFPHLSRRLIQWLACSTALFRLELLPRKRDYATFIAVVRKITDKALQEDPRLLMWCEQEVTRMGEDT